MKHYKLIYFVFLGLIFFVHTVVQENYKPYVFPFGLFISITLMLYRFYTLVKITEENKNITFLQKMKPLINPVLSMFAIALTLYLFWHFITN